MAQPSPGRKCITLGGFDYLVQFPTQIPGHYELEHLLEPTGANRVPATQETPTPKGTDVGIQGANETNSNYLARRKLRQLNTGMAEPRVRLTRHQGQLNFGNELGASGKKGLEEFTESLVDGADGSVAGRTGTGMTVGKKGKEKASSVVVTGKRGTDSISEGGMMKKRKSLGGSVP
ncbi:TFIID subunit [Histoplasma capsulatum]|uniref:TFIID subunit n=1 Tax=Ajellomyces capsulatus TaxID=5037 RepID=A0A8A1M3K7_AJECA|nr:TFIID subunit [Histoplasma capsulatum]